MAQFHEDIVTKTKLKRNVKNNDAFLAVTKTLGIQGTPMYNKLINTIIEDAENGTSECAKDIVGLDTQTKPEPQKVKIETKNIAVETIPAIYVVTTLVDLNQSTFSAEYKDVIMRIPLEEIVHIDTYKKSTFSIYTKETKMKTIPGYPIWTSYMNIPHEELASYNIKKVVNYGESIYNIN